MFIAFYQILDGLKTIARNTKAAIIGITEFKLDNFMSDGEVEIPCYCILRCGRNKNVGRVGSYVRQDVCFNLRGTVMGDIHMNNLQTSNINFLECFEKYLDDINLDNEIFFLGDFNINLLNNDKYIFKEKKVMRSRIPSTS